MAKEKIAYVCTSCGYDTPKWIGKCPACGEWNTFVEQKLGKTKVQNTVNETFSLQSKSSPISMSKIKTEDEPRINLLDSELNRVLGGGLVPGSMTLLGGEPGIGKSTLILQTVLRLKGKRILYVSGEESARQLKLRADRLVEKYDGEASSEALADVQVVCEAVIETVFEHVKAVDPDIVIIDSIQTMFDPEVSSAPGSISQVRECTMQIMRATKEQGFTTFVVGHINKEGSIAGPKVLEHMVDCVLYFEGERSTSFRILRAAKNRFGSTNEIGVFEMADKGLRELKNPSEILLSGRPQNAPGTCVTCVIEGSRPILAEIQALIAPASYNAGRRNANGIDYNRATLLLAVLEKRCGMAVSGCDAYINVIGGLELGEPAADLATLLAIASSFRDTPLGCDLAAVGEIGLSGEIRSVSSLNMRLSEIARLGFKRCVIPAHIKDDIKKPEGLEIISVKDIREAIKAVL